MGGEFLNMMEIFIKENLNQIEPTDMGNIYMKMVLYITVIGLMIYSLELDMKFGKIVLNMWENIIMVKKMG